MHGKFYGGTPLHTVLPVMNGGGAELLVWATFGGIQGLYLPNKTPFLDPAKDQFVASSPEALLFSPEGLEHLAQVEGQRVFGL